MKSRAGSLVSKRKLLSFALILLLSLPTVAQFRITGIVKDASNGKALAGADITVENTFFSTYSQEDGSFAIHPIPAGKHTFRFSYMGYQNKNLTLELFHDTTISVNMEHSAILGEEVNIVATKAQPRTPATFSNIPAKKIDEINLGKDLPYLLQSTPSIVVTSDAGTGIGYTGISIRGTDLTRINVTMNGIPVNDPESQGVWFVDLPDIASSSANIQIQRGVGTSTNGSGAFGASINIQTQTAKQDPYADINSSAGSYNTFKNTFRFGTGRIKDHFSIDGRASFLTSEGYIDRASARLHSYFLSGGYFGKNTTIKFNILSGYEKTYQAWNGVPKDSLSTNRTYNPSGEYIDKKGNIAYYDNQTDNYNQDHYQLIFSQGIGKKININAALFYTHGQGYYENYKPGESFSSYGLNDVVIGNDTITSTDLINRKILDNDFSGITFSGNYNSGDRWKVTLGGSFSNYNGRHSGKVIWAEFASDGNNERNWYYSTGEKKDFTLFTKVTYRLLNRINLFGDMQYRYVDHTMKGTEDDLSVIDQQHKFNFFNPKAGIFFDITEKQKAYISFGIANREPNRDNYKDADPQHMPSNETLYDYEAGYDMGLSKFKGTVNLYYMKYHNQLVLTGEINNTGAAIMTNVPESYRAGLEISLAANIFKWLNWNANATLSRNKIRNFTEYVDLFDSDWNFLGQQKTELGETDLSFSPAINGMNEFVFIPFRGFSLSLLSRYTGKQYIDNTSNQNRILKAYFIQNVTASYSFRPKWCEEIGFTLQVNNVFSNKYETNAWVYRYFSGGAEHEMNGYFPQAPVNYLAGFHIRF